MTPPARGSKAVVAAVPSSAGVASYWAIRFAAEVASSGLAVAEAAVKVAAAVEVSVAITASKADFVASSS